MARALSAEYHDYSEPYFEKEQKHASAQKAGPGSVPSSPVDTYNEEQDKEIFLQPETRPITQEQLVNEVKGSLHRTRV